MSYRTFTEPAVLSPRVSAGEAHRVQVSERKAAAVPGGRLPVAPSALLPQVPGADGVCSAHHRAGGAAVTR